ncbi:MAG: hypothetical protein ACK55K_05400 [Bacteroidota bacterium]|jgi:hypothetical protein
MKHLFCLICCWGCLFIRSQHLPDPLLSAVAGMGAYGHSNTDVFGMLLNPASVANSATFSTGIYGERKYLLEGLQQFCGLLQFPLLKSGLGFQLDYVGSALMNETALGMVYGKMLGDRLSMGLRFQYYQLQVPGYVRAPALWAGAGLLFQLTPQLQTGFSFTRSAKPQLHSSEPPLTQVYRFGMGYEPSQRVCISTDWIKETNKDLMGTISLRYAFEEGFRLRLAWQTTTQQPVAGAGLYWKGTWTDLLISYHPHLGFTPAFQMSWNASGKKSN